MIDFSRHLKARVYHGLCALGSAENESSQPLSLLDSNKKLVLKSCPWLTWSGRVGAGRKTSAAVIKQVWNWWLEVAVACRSSMFILGQCKSPHQLRDLDTYIRMWYVLQCRLRWSCGHGTRSQLRAAPWLSSAAPEETLHRPSSGKKKEVRYGIFLPSIFKVDWVYGFFLNFGQTNILRRRHSNRIKDYTEQIPTNSIELRRAEGVINASERDQVEHKDSRALMARQACRIQALNGFDLQNFLLTESYVSAFHSTVKGWNNWGQSGASAAFKAVARARNPGFLSKKKRNKMEVGLLNPAATSAVSQHNKEDLLSNVSTEESLQ